MAESPISASGHVTEIIQQVPVQGWHDASRKCSGLGRGVPVRLRPEQVEFLGECPQAEAFGRSTPYHIQAFAQSLNGDDIRLRPSNADVVRVADAVGRVCSNERLVGPESEGFVFGGYNEPTDGGLSYIVYPLPDEFRDPNRSFVP